MLSQERLQQALDQPLRYHESVDSTNDIASEWLRAGADDLSLVIADEQRRGRGRRGRVWYTPPGVALAVSIIIKPPVTAASRASMVGALAVYDLCENVGADDVGIKWPNDVQIAGKKVSGILPEAIWQDGKLLGIVLGIGVNVRNRLADELSQQATTLAIATGNSPDRVALIATLLSRVQHWYRRISGDEIISVWRNRLTTLDQNVLVTGADTHIVGQAVDVRSDGALLIKTADGSIQAVLAGDVSLRPQT